MKVNQHQLFPTLQVYGFFWSSVPGVYAIGDVAAFLLKIQDTLDYRFESEMGQYRGIYSALFNFAGRWLLQDECPRGLRCW